MVFEEELKTHLDAEGRLIRMPAKFKSQVMALYWLADFFQSGKIYAQAEIDAILLDRHLFNDCCALRRGLVDFQLLERTRDGRNYWVNPHRPEQSNWLFPHQATKEEPHGKI